jgi:hypothetical protein
MKKKNENEMINEIERDEKMIKKDFNYPFNFNKTEGQSRRESMADCDSDCSQILGHLFVSGAKIARSIKDLEANGITRIINCSSAAVDNHFISNPKMKYLSLNMLDGKQDDISWFLSDVISFIKEGETVGERTLLHCEKGVSRSCSFAIAYYMWTTGNPNSNSNPNSNLSPNSIGTQAE